MKLIDADKLITKLWDRYCHYACNGRDLNKSAFLNVCLGAVDVQEEVEAIPIEWIEEWLKKMPKHTTPYFYKSFLRNAIRGMVEDWEKENE